MKKKSNFRQILMLLFFLLIFLVIPLIEVNFDGLREDTNFPNRLQSSSGYSEPFIHIDGSIPGNWSNTVSTYLWCDGSGTLNDPYIIENVSIDASSSPTGSGIFINNSKNDYFIIRNCTVYDTVLAAQNSGIQLKNTCNGTINNNNCSTSSYGISLLDNCRNISIISNILNENLFSGILFQNNCSYNFIENNEINKGLASITKGIYFNTNNSHNVINMNNLTDIGEGIQLTDNEDYNEIKNNNISNNGYKGLNINKNSDYNEILNNTIHDNGHSGPEPGIYIDDMCEDTIISNNSIYHNGEDGIYVISFCHRTLISDNTIHDNLRYGIVFTVHNKNVTISDNSICDNDNRGIYFNGIEAENVKILNNNVSNNLGHGIHISHDCDDAQVIGNNVINNLDDGINLRDTNGGLVSDNYVYLSGVYGIRLYDVCDNTNVTGNTIIKSVNDGIYIADSVNCRVSSNNVFENLRGIEVYTSDNTNITNNIVKYNTLTGIVTGTITNVFLKQNLIEEHSNYGLRLGSCSNSRFSENRIINSVVGISLSSNSDSNNFTYNYIKDCTSYGTNIEVGNDLNLFYENYFVINQINALDDGTSNFWNNSYIGNFWSNYIGTDLNKDGIGDTPQDINGVSTRKDFLPIYNNLPSIYIDEYTQNNWKWASQFYWCNGSGTSEDPYIIENKIIDLRWSSNRIEIRNSNKYFIIRNCTLLNNRAGYSGILLHNTMNGKIIDCESEDNEIGIKLEGCNSINVSGNEANNNLRGISLINSDESNILGNTINQNGIGLELWQSNYNSIRDNTLLNNEMCILEIDCISNTFENNDCPLGDLYITIINQVFSSQGFNVTFYIINTTLDPIDTATFQIWWDGQDVSINSQNLGGGLYLVSLDPITVEEGEDPILLNMTISASGYTNKYFETDISVRPCDLIDLLFIEFFDQIYTEDYFNLTFYITNATSRGIEAATLQILWDGTDVSTDVQNLGEGLYFISLEPKLVSPGEDPIILEINVEAIGYQDLNYQTEITIDPESVIKGATKGGGGLPILIPIIIGVSIGGGLSAVGVFIFLRKRKLGKK